MKQVNLRTVDYNTCRAGLVNVLPGTVDTYLDGTSEICAGGETMKDACTVLKIKKNFIFFIFSIPV